MTFYMTFSAASWSGRACRRRGTSFYAGGCLLLVTAFGTGTIALIQAQVPTRSYELGQPSFSAPGATVDTPKADFTNWSAIRIKAYGKALGVSFPEPMAVVEIPRLHLRAPLFDGIDDLTLDRGLGHIPGTALPEQDGNLAIAGHRDSFFRVLKDIRVGDTIKIATSDGNDTYEVERTTVVDPSKVNVLKPQSKPALTLVTCYPFYFIGHAPQRFIVEAFLTQRLSRQRQQPRPAQSRPDAKER